MQFAYERIKKFAEYQLKNLNNDFEKCFSKLLNSKNLQITLSNNIKKLAKPLATEKIINEIKTLLKG